MLNLNHPLAIGNASFSLIICLNWTGTHSNRELSAAQQRHVHPNLILNYGDFQYLVV